MNFKKNMNFDVFLKTRGGDENMTKHHRGDGVCGDVFIPKLTEATDLDTKLSDCVSFFTCVALLPVGKRPSTGKQMYRRRKFSSDYS